MTTISDNIVRAIQFVRYIKEFWQELLNYCQFKHIILTKVNNVIFMYIDLHSGVSLMYIEFFNLFYYK